MRSYDAFLLRAMSATKETAAGLDTVADDLAAAMFTFRRQRMDRALKAVEIMGDAIDDYLQIFIVLVPANFTLSHVISFFQKFTIVSL